jgi:hypothetical protein
VGRNIVQLLSALASQSSTALRGLRLLHQSQLGELLENVAIDLSGTQSEVVWSASESLGSAEDLSQSTNTNVGSDVDSTCDGGSTGVDPVGIIGSELLESSCLDDISPLRKIIYRATIIESNIPLGSRTFLESSSA